MLADRVVFAERRPPLCSSEALTITGQEASWLLRALSAASPACAFSPEVSSCPMNPTFFSTDYEHRRFIGLPDKPLSRQRPLPPAAEYQCRCSTQQPPAIFIIFQLRLCGERQGYMEPPSIPGTALEIYTVSPCSPHAVKMTSQK